MRLPYFSPTKEIRMFHRANFNIQPLTFKTKMKHQTGGYGSVEAMGKMVLDLEAWESKTGEGEIANRLFYFAIPPDVFLDTAASIKQVGMSTTGFTRLVVEKPFGHDFESALKVRFRLSSLRRDHS